MRILDEFLAYERRVNVDGTLGANRFINYGKWYVNDKYLRKIFTYPIQSTENRIHSLRTKTALKMGKYIVMKSRARESFPSAADVFEIKHSGERIRAFYTTGRAQPYTLKVVCDINGGNFTDELIHEVAVRKKLERLNIINIPKVLGTDQWKDAFVLTEEMAFGRQFKASSDRTLYRKSLLPQLRDMYQAYGVRYVPIREFLTPDISQRVFGLVRERADGQRFADALQGVISGNGVAAVSLCHGGLGPGNIAVANGGVFFLDWKRAHEGLIIVDLLRAAVKYPRYSYIVRYIRQMITSSFIDDSCRFEALLTVGIALEIVRAPERIAKILRMWRIQVC